MRTNGQGLKSQFFVNNLIASGWPAIRSEAVDPIGGGQLPLTLQVKFAASLVLPLPL